MRIGPSIAAAFALLAAPAIAQEERPSAEAERDCRDDRGVDRCAPAQQQRVLALFGVPPIEQLRDAGAQVRRAFYVDGYGNDLVAISFIRAPGADPAISLHWPPSRAGVARPPAQALAPAQMWQEVLTRSQHFERALVPPAESGGPDAIPICMHSWVFTVEASEPRRGTSEPRLRRKVEDACAGGLAQPYAMELARLALSAFPFCAALDSTQHRNEASQLAACGLLGGDRLAAAQAMNLERRLGELSSLERATAARNVFDYRAALDWNGEQLGGERQAAALAWIERTRTLGANLSLHRWVGEQADRVRAEGVLYRRIEQEEAAATLLRAPVTFIFTRRSADGIFQIERATVGAFSSGQSQPAGGGAAD